MNLTHNVLSYSVVGLWANPLPGVPPLDPNLLRQLFNEPYTTQLGMTPEGIIVQKLGKPPVPAVLFGPLKFSVLNVTIEETARILDAVMVEALRKTNQQIPLVRSLGINTEHEWIKPDFRPAESWLGSQFIRRGLHDVPAEVGIDAKDLQFRVTLPGRVFNVQLQPRSGNDSAIFGAINDHRESWNQNVPSGDAVRQLLRESVEEISNRLTPFITGGIAGA